MIETENKLRTELGELGEFTLIEHLTKDFEILGEYMEDENYERD